VRPIGGSRLRVPAALMAATLALAAAGCGSDGEKAAETTTTPTVTMPTTDTSTTPPAAPRHNPATATDGGQDVPPSGANGGTPAPGGGNGGTGTSTAPKPGSAADRFEQQCRQTPGACD
jgi:hypothetical protein